MKGIGMRSAVIVFTLVVLTLFAYALKGYSADTARPVQWEYVVKEVDFKGDRLDFETMMNALGAEGWEIFHIESINYQSIVGYTVFGRRPKK